MDNNNRSTLWLFLLGMLLIISLTVLGVFWLINNTIVRTVSSVENTAGGLSTQVAQALNPTPTILPDPVTIVVNIRGLARLETIQYTLEKVIAAETGQGTFGFLFGDKLIFVAHGYVIAGIDLTRVTPEDLNVQDGVLYVRLPEPEVFVVTLDNEKSYVFNRETGVLTHGDVNLESTARQAAEQEIFNAAITDGILDIARQNGENYMYRLLRNLGFQEVIFLPSATPTPDPND